MGWRLHRSAETQKAWNKGSLLNDEKVFDTNSIIGTDEQTEFYLYRKHRVNLEVFDSTGKCKFVLNLDGTRI